MRVRRVACPSCRSETAKGTPNLLFIMTFANTKLLDFFLGATFVCALLICITSIFPYFACHWWFFDLFSHFRVQMLLCLLVACVLLLFSQVKKTIGVFVFFIVLHLIEIVPLYRKPAVRGPTHENTLTVCLINVNSRTGDPDKVLTTCKNFSRILL